MAIPINRDAHNCSRSGYAMSLPSLTIMAKKKKPFIKLQCTQCKKVNYFTQKSKKVKEIKLELKKFCPWCRKHTAHKEGKK